MVHQILLIVSHVEFEEYLFNDLGANTDTHRQTDSHDLYIRRSFLLWKQRLIMRNPNSVIHTGHTIWENYHGWACLWSERHGMAYIQNFGGEASPLGRTRRELENNIKMGHREMQVEADETAPGPAPWRALLLAALNDRIPLERS
jgi:hypothetical protein